MAIRQFGAAAAVTAALALASPAHAVTELQWWHAMSGVLADRLNELVEKFNTSQDKYTVVAVAKGNYDEVTNGVIAAYRARGLVPLRHLRIEGWSSLLLWKVG